jgi:uncharacterized protein
MIIDVLAHAGPWNRRPVGQGAAGLLTLLRPYQVSTVYAGRTEALWFENPHDANRLLDGTQTSPDIVDVPVLDPSIATWRDELEQLVRLKPRLPMVRLLPGYGGYTLDLANPLLDQLARRKIVAQVIVQMDDPRRQHRLAQVPDVPAAAVLDASARHPGLQVLLSGASGPSLLSLASRLPKSNNLWADTAHADGLGTIPSLVGSPWRERLVFGSHAPLFIPYLGVARVLLDLDDPTAELLFRTNAGTLLSPASTAP